MWFVISWSGGKYHKCHRTGIYCVLIALFVFSTYLLWQYLWVLKRSLTSYNMAPKRIGHYEQVHRDAWNLTAFRQGLCLNTTLVLVMSYLLVEYGFWHFVFSSHVAVGHSFFQHTSFQLMHSWRAPGTAQQLQECLKTWSFLAVLQCGWKNVSETDLRVASIEGRSGTSIPSITLVAFDAISLHQWTLMNLLHVM